MGTGGQQRSNGDAPPTTKTPPTAGAAVRFCTSAGAAACAEVMTLPIDVTKVRLQTGFYGSSTQLGVARRIVRTEGWAALWKGLLPALVRQCSYTGLSLVLYEPMRDAIAGGVAPADLPFWKRVLAGGAAGGTSIFVMNPTDVLKARMQNSAVRLSFGSTTREIVAQRGVRGLWAGSTPNVARCFVGNAAELGCYDHFKCSLVAVAGLPADASLTHFGASTGAGFVSAVFSTPVDVLKTRLQAGAGVRDETLLGLALRIPRDEGFGAFYKGFWPLFQRKVLWTVVFFVTYEKLKLGLATLVSSSSSSTTT